MYLINLENVKKIQEANKDKRDQLDREIAIHLDKILRSLKLKDVSLLGRSAGGGQIKFHRNLICCEKASLFQGQCIHIAKLSAENDDYVKALNLACPGYKKDGIIDFIEARLDKPIPIRFCWAIEDTTVPIHQGYQMKQQLIDSGYIKQGANLLKFVEISTNSDKPAINHRVHKELIYMLE
jgi:hypothetical protein